MQDAQTLVDLMFQIGLTIHSNKELKRKSKEDLAAWIAEQLKNNGFPTEPCGASWGLLKQS